MRIQPSILSRPVLAAIATSMTLVGLSCAYAATESPAVKLYYQSQDVATAGGAQQLLRRIEFAAHEACADQALQPLVVQAAARRCYLAAVAGAVKQVHAPQVRAAYVAKYGPLSTSSEAREAPSPRMQKTRHS